jgi:hypothetical protein
MAKSQENGTTILLGLKGYEVGMVAECEGKIIVKVKTEKGILFVPTVVRWSCIATARVKQGGCFTVGAMAKGFTLSYVASAGGAGTVATPLMTVLRYYNLIPG